MSSRTSRWAAQVQPGPPAARSRAPSAGPPPTIYPESSVSNPDASRYTGRSSRARSASIDYAPSRRDSYYTSASHSSARHSSSRSSRASSPTPMPVYHSSSRQPIVARTSDMSGRTESYVILPARGQKVEILQPTPIRTSSTSPVSSPSYYSYSSPPSPRKERPLLRKLLDKVDWSSERSSRRSSSVSHSPSSSYHSSRTRRNSTGGGSGGSWTVYPDSHRSDRDSRRSVDSGSRGTVTTVRSGGVSYNVVRL